MVCRSPLIVTFWYTMCCVASCEQPSSNYLQFSCAKAVLWCIYTLNRTINKRHLVTSGHLFTVGCSLLHRSGLLTVSTAMCITCAYFFPPAIS